MADPLSLAASSFAAVGVVDVLLRASVECCRFLAAIKDAPEEIQRLQTLVEENIALTEVFKVHLDGLQNVTNETAIPRIEEALKLFKTAIKSCSRETTALKTLEARYKGASKIWSAMRHLLDEKKLNKYLGNLENAKSMLGAALLLVEEVRSAARQEAIEAAVVQNSTDVMTISKVLLQNVSSIRQSQNEGTKLQSDIATRSAQHARATSLVRRELRNNIRLNKAQHAQITTKIAEGTRLILQTIDSKFPGLESEKARIQYSREYHCLGRSREVVFDLLGHMKTPLQRAILLAIAQSLDVDWVQKEFSNLLQSATQESAALCRRTTATSVDRWIYSSTQYSALPHAGQTVYEDFLSSDTEINDTPSSPYLSTDMVREDWTLLGSKEISYVSSLGVLHLNVPTFREKDVSMYDLREAHIMFIPAADVCTASLGIRFVHRLTRSLEPKLYTHLNAFHLIESPRLHWDIIGSGTLENIDTAFRNGSISPYDQIRTGWMICFRLAGKHFRSDLLRYLHCQGVCISSVNGEDDVLCGAWGSLQSAELDAHSEHSLEGILRIIAESAPHGSSAQNTVLLHAYCWLPTREVTERRKRMIKTMLTFIKGRGFDLNRPNLKGRTPFLDHMLARGGASLAIARTLLELGADPHAVDQHGENAIQLAMFSNVAWDQNEVHPLLRKSREFPEILLGKLALLIEAGVSLDHKNYHGDTVYSDARQYNCLDVLREALELCGKSFERIIEDTEV